MYAEPWKRQKSTKPQEGIIMAKIASNVLDLIGGTPLVELTDIAEAH